jgi:hypothetical protein
VLNDTLRFIILIWLLHEFLLCRLACFSESIMFFSTILPELCLDFKGCFVLQLLRVNFHFLFRSFKNIWVFIQVVLFGIFNKRKLIEWRKLTWYLLIIAFLYRFLFFYYGFYLLMLRLNFVDFFFMMVIYCLKFWDNFWQLLFRYFFFLFPP